MRHTSIWLTVSMLLVALGWYADQARSSCATSCGATNCLQEKKDDGTVRCLTNNYYYGEMYHPGTPAVCGGENPKNIVMYITSSCGSACGSGWGTGGGATRRAGQNCGGGAAAHTVVGCATCVGGT